jgi:hypothetical protein
VFFAVRAPGIVGPYFVPIAEIYTEMQHTFWRQFWTSVQLWQNMDFFAPPPQIKSQQQLMLKTVLCVV